MTLPVPSAPPRPAPAPPDEKGPRRFRAIDPERDRAEVVRLLERAVEHDYVLGIVDRWLAAGGVLGGFQRDRLVAIQRLDDLGGGEGWIGAIRVAREERRKGWGADLTRYALAVAREHGISTVRLTIDDENTASRALSRSLGFRPAAAMAHTVGVATAPSAPREEKRISPVAVTQVAGLSIEGLEGVRRLSGAMLITTPRPQRFARATLDRLRNEAAAGRLFQWGDDPRVGLFVMSPLGWAGARDGRRFRMLAPLGSSVREVFEAVSLPTRSERGELEGFLPSEGLVLRDVERVGWRTGASAFWGARIHLYEVRT